MYLVDTNVWLKRLLDKERSEEVGFGTFIVRKKGARKGRNLKTGEEIPIAPRKVVTFKASQQLKAIVEKV